MPRSVNSVAKEQEEKIMKLAKGYFGRQNVWTVAKECGRKAMCYAYRDRKVKKFPCFVDSTY
jgi:large subunit ribosomal protein L20